MQAVNGSSAADHPPRAGSGLLNEEVQLEQGAKPTQHIDLYGGCFGLAEPTRLLLDLIAKSLPVFFSFLSTCYF